jgi:hypothetical protein
MIPNGQYFNFDYYKKFTCEQKPYYRKHIDTLRRRLP